MEWKDVNTRCKVDVCRTLRSSGEKHVLRRCEAVNGRGVMLGEVLTVKASTIHIFDLFQTLLIRLREGLSFFWFNVVENAELKPHPLSTSFPLVVSFRGCCDFDFLNRMMR